MNSATCANHGESRAIARCARCRTAFCDPCVTHLVNDEPWCEPCANVVLEKDYTRPIGAVVVGLVLLAAFAGLIYWQLYYLGRFYIYSSALGVVPFLVAWRIAFPTRAGEAPRVVDRRARAPRPPVPMGKRLT